MIAAPCLVVRDKRGNAKRVEALVPVPVAGLFAWNTRLRLAQEYGAR